MLSKLNVEQIARETKFYKANPRKVSITNLMLSFFSMALIGKNEYSKWAEYIGTLIEDTVSKVALWKRMNKEQVQCLQAILEETFKIKVYQKYLSSKNDMVLFSPFGEVYLQDSTIISLPDELSDLYKGSVSKGKQKSSIRIQAIYGLLSGTFKEFNLGSFTENDQVASGGIVNILKPGDLIIRDLGYFVLKVFKQIDLIKAFFLSRYRYGVNIYDANLYNNVSGAYLYKSCFYFKIFLKHKKLISLLKLCSYIAAHKERIFACETIDDLEKEIAYYTTFEKRRKRNNHLEMYMNVFDYQGIN